MNWLISGHVRGNRNIEVAIMQHVSKAMQLTTDDYLSELKVAKPLIKTMADLYSL